MPSIEGAGAVALTGAAETQALAAAGSTAAGVSETSGSCFCEQDPAMSAAIATSPSHFMICLQRPWPAGPRNG